MRGGHIPLFLILAAWRLIRFRIALFYYYYPITSLEKAQRIFATVPSYLAPEWSVIAWDLS